MANLAAAVSSVVASIAPEQRRPLTRPQSELAVVRLLCTACVRMVSALVHWRQWRALPCHMCPTERDQGDGIRQLGRSAAPVSVVAAYRVVLDVRSHVL